MILIVSSLLNKLTQKNTGSSIDRIFQAYRLPIDIRPLNGASLHTRDGISTARLRQAKILALFEYLGAWKIVEHERLKRSGW